MEELNNYTVKNEIGQGGMAMVYLAEHKTLHKPVAIKVLNKEFVHNENIRKRFLAEARNLFGMSHPNIIKVTDLIDQDDLVAFVMEYIEGQTLKDYLDKKGKLTDEEIKQLFTQMLDAVGYVHEQGLIHRDIKPSNFMISGKGVLRLLDFGISKNTDTSSAEYTMTGTTQNMGTPMYMSPEQVKSTKDVTPQTDIYSLGVVLWQMVMGICPYDTRTMSTFEIQTKIVNEDLDVTNTPFDSLIKRMTIKNMDLRYDTIGLIQNDIIRLNLISEVGNRSYEKLNDESTEVNRSKMIEKINNFIYCPKCYWQPSTESLWGCECGHEWNTFDTKGLCPSCNKKYTDTQCLNCSQVSKHSDWYHNSPSNSTIIEFDTRVFILKCLSILIEKGENELKQKLINEFHYPDDWATTFVKQLKNSMSEIDHKDSYENVLDLLKRGNAEYEEGVNF